MVMELEMGGSWMSARKKRNMVQLRNDECLMLPLEQDGMAMAMWMGMGTLEVLLWRKLGMVTEMRMRKRMKRMG
jgi:hypothetical protein